MLRHAPFANTPKLQMGYWGTVFPALGHIFRPSRRRPLFRRSPPPILQTPSPKIPDRPPKFHTLPKTSYLQFWGAGLPTLVFFSAFRPALHPTHVFPHPDPSYHALPQNSTPCTKTSTPSPRIPHRPPKFHTVPKYSYCNFGVPADPNLVFFCLQARPGL